MVAEVVVARQPDTAFDDRELAAEATQRQGLAGVHASGGGPIKLRIHHQSPCCVMQSSSLWGR
jgi:hypothetical protein